MRGLRKLEGRTVTVHQTPGPSLQGVLHKAYRDCFVLLHSTSLDDKEDLKGQVVVPRVPGVWIQVTTPELP